MPTFDVTDFVELLSLQNRREMENEETEITETTKITSQSVLTNFLETKKEKEFQEEIESKYKKEELPPDYFFSALAEIILM